MKSEPDEIEVYLGLSSVFWGPESKIRRRKVIESRLRLCKQSPTHNPSAFALIKKYQFKPVVTVCKRLLKAGVFENEQMASAHFAGMDHPNTQNTAENEDVKNEGIENKKDMMATVNCTFHTDINGDRGHCQSHEVDRIVSSSTDERPRVVAAINARLQEMPPTAPPPIQLHLAGFLSVSSHPQINSACLPYKAQHTLLVRTQGILENACFKYAIHKMPRVLQSRRWVVPECGELHVWVRILKYEAEVRFKKEVVPHPHPSWDSFFQSIGNLRHKAVHREQLTGSDIESYLRDAQNFARLLRDDEGAETLAKLRKETRDCLEKFESCKKNISRTFQAKMDEINTRRAELDTLERQAKQDLVQEDITIQTWLGSDLKETVVIAEVPQAKEEAKDTDDHDECKTPVGFFASLWYLIMWCRRFPPRLEREHIN
ncbi:hypothetical protein LZ32DRAFT_648916 [Colletotrichum eremochloae]|nr:hypothetical protein LZ32DRAFT_648916 [Colletotrichum eremochloae]